MPLYLERNEHGTRCAGEIAAVKNDYCGVGVAFESRISGDTCQVLIEKYLCLLISEAVI